MREQRKRWIEWKWINHKRKSRVKRIKSLLLYIFFLWRGRLAAIPSALRRAPMSVKWATIGPLSSAFSSCRQLLCRRLADGGIHIRIEYKIEERHEKIKGRSPVLTITSVYSVYCLSTKTMRSIKRSNGTENLPCIAFCRLEKKKGRRRRRRRKRAATRRMRHPLNWQQQYPVSMYPPFSLFPFLFLSIF